MGGTVGCHDRGAEAAVIARRALWGLVGGFAIVGVLWALLGAWEPARWSWTAAGGLGLGASLEALSGPRLHVQNLGTRGWALWRDDAGRWRWLLWHESGVARGHAGREDDARVDLGAELDALLERDARAGDRWLRAVPAARCSCGTPDGEPCPAAPFMCDRDPA